MSKPGHESGRRIPMVVTFLEMTAKPGALPPPVPKGKIAIMRAVHPPVHFYRYLYDTIGDPYFWVDRRKLTDAALAQGQKTWENRERARIQSGWKSLQPASVKASNGTVLTSLGDSSVLAMPASSVSLRT